MPLCAVSIIFIQAWQCIAVRFVCTYIAAHEPFQPMKVHCRFHESGGRAIETPYSIGTNLGDASLLDLPICSRISTYINVSSCCGVIAKLPDVDISELLTSNGDRT